MKTWLKIGFEGRILLKALLAGLGGTVAAMFFLWSGPFSLRGQLTLTILIAALWLGFALAARVQVVSALRTLSNLMAAVREGDFSVRPRVHPEDDALKGVLVEMGQLVESLQSQRLDAREAAVLLRRVMEEIDVAVFAFDEAGCLRLVNRSGERLLARPAERLLGCPAADLGLADCLKGEAATTRDLAFPGGSGRWSLRRSEFRQGGLPHQLLVMANLSRTLREEERQAWQRLIRTLGHELNNSLAPIKSIAGSLATMLHGDTPPAGWLDDARRGLAVVLARSEALERFMQAYSRIARLPEPQRRPMDVGEWVRRTALLETRLVVEIRPGPPLDIEADCDQMEQLLINLIRNAADAALETSGGVRVGWVAAGPGVDVWVEDDGPGLANPDNLFVPFYTTKPGGSGIGLVFSRQIAEAHGGTLALENRATSSGCVAHLRLPCI